MIRRLVWTAGVALVLGACGGEKAAPEGGAGSGAAPAPLEGGGTVSGVVSFRGTAPSNPVISMAEEASCQAHHGGSPRDPRVVVTNGHLANVFVYVKAGLPAGATYAAPSTPVVLDQQGCLYHPRVLGVMVGQRLAIHNSDSLLHNIKAVPSENRGFNVSQPGAGMTTDRTFSRPEVMIPLECSVHGWMHAWVGVLPHPFFATTGVDGRFSLEHLPPGTYTIEAWHETYGTQTATVTVTGTESQTSAFTFAAR